MLLWGPHILWIFGRNSAVFLVPLSYFHLFIIAKPASKMRGWTRRWRQLSIALHHRICPPGPSNCFGWSMFTTPCQLHHWPISLAAHLWVPATHIQGTGMGSFLAFGPRLHILYWCHQTWAYSRAAHQQISIPWQQTYLKAWSTIWVRGFDWWQSISSFPVQLKSSNVSRVPQGSSNLSCLQGHNSSGESSGACNCLLP